MIFNIKLFEFGLGNNYEIIISYDNRDVIERME